MKGVEDIALYHNNKRYYPSKLYHDLRKKVESLEQDNKKLKDIIDNLKLKLLSYITRG
jgi:hypothetical protein